MGHKLFFLLFYCIHKLFFIVAIFGIREKFWNFWYHVVLGLISSKVSKFSRQDILTIWKGQRMGMYCLYLSYKGEFIYAVIRAGNDTNLHRIICKWTRHNNHHVGNTATNWSMSMSICDKVSMLLYRHLSEKNLYVDVCV